MTGKRLAVFVAFAGAQTIAVFVGPAWLRAALCYVQCGIVGYSLGSLVVHKQRLADLKRHAEQVQDMEAIMGRLVELMRQAGWDMPRWPGAPLTDDEKAGLN